MLDLKNRVRSYFSGPILLLEAIIVSWGVVFIPGRSFFQRGVHFPEAFFVFRVRSFCQSGAIPFSVATLFPEAILFSETNLFSGRY